ncbi:MAG: NADP-dependent malic enzyme [Rhodospirillaceae bacterium]|nr:NADP-dependent malic enzyme [Rhodospirillaceae bacterium]|tara:strand:- start:111 stop:2387 length:2277 start_codon:yes stop_codon:yes gene_type:complete
MSDDLNKMALEYHRNPKAGKISVQPTKRLANQVDLSLAYSPGVAAACNEIKADPLNAAEYTVRSNLVGVITNGTAVLGLGNIGPLASKPVMEGKGVLFKKFADIDVFDIEVDASDPSKFIDTVSALEPTFGGINLEDIKAPECFIIEKALREKMKIPVFHDDQHGTAICVAAALINGLRIIDKDISKANLVCSGAGAAALACLDLLVEMGMKPDNIIVCDRLGVIHKGRKSDLDEYKLKYAIETNARDLNDAIEDADIFLGVSTEGVLSKDMVKKMSSRPLILALANPNPEILPEDVTDVRPDALIATGRSDYPNQVNNVLCFPFMFRGALDVGATEINEAMKIAAVYAIADLAKAEVSDVVAKAYSGQQLEFGPNYLIPKPFDPRLIIKVSSAVAKAAIETGVATRPIDDLRSYEDKLAQYVYRTGFVMKPIFEQARSKPMKIAYAEAEEENVLRAVKIAIDEGIASPILIGRRYVIEMRMEKAGLHFSLDKDVEIIDPEDDTRYREYWTTYHNLMSRKGVSPNAARTIVRTRNTVIGALAVKRGDADALVCGYVGRYGRHLQYCVDILGLEEGVTAPCALQLLVTPNKTIFITDTEVNLNPSADQISEIVSLSSKVVEKFGIKPNIALITHSNFGSHSDSMVSKMQQAFAKIKQENPSLNVDGEMNADLALSESSRNYIFPDGILKGEANLLVMANQDSASVSFALAKSLTDGLSVGPILAGLSKVAHIVNPSITVRGLVNITALASVQASSSIKE